MLQRSIQIKNKRKPYKTYTKAFKIEAVRLMNESDKSPSELATEFGIRRNQLYKWKEQLEVKPTGMLPLHYRLKSPRRVKTDYSYDTQGRLNSQTTMDSL